jgi:fatty-acid desaturase
MRTRAWHRSVGALLVIPTLSLGVYLDPSALVYSLALYFVILLSMTCGYHRLFAHASYTTPRGWHWLFGIVGSIGVNSSPAQWAMVHSAHHRYSDTAQDPYITDWRYFFRFKDITDVSPGRAGLRLLRDPMHQFLFNHSFTLSLSYAILILLLGGLWGLLYLYALPVSLFLFVSGIHSMYSHNAQGPLDRPWLEFILPFCGEWLHREHHIKPHLTTYPGGMDLGGQFIELIRTDGIRSTNRTPS